MSKLPYLVSEVNAAMEVYLAGRTGQQYNRTTFILCDDCAELASKLFLIRGDRKWSDKGGGKPFKSFLEVTTEVRAAFSAKRSGEHGAVDEVLKRIEGRRDRRNKFFHSTDLLDLTLQPADCVRALVDLLDFGKLLFQADWDAAVAAAGTMETSEAVLRIDKKSFADPSVVPMMNEILRCQPRVGARPVKKGCEVAYHPEDIHLRLAIRNGHKELRDRLRALLR